MIDLDDEAALLVLADELQAAGDPRGELIAVQRELARRPTGDARGRLLTAEARLIQACLPAELRGKNGRRLQLSWRLGHIVRAYYRSTFTAPESLDEQILTALFACGPASALRELHVGWIEGGDYARIARLIATHAPAALRTLVVEPLLVPGPWRVDVGPLSGRMPQLERLDVHATEPDLGDAHFPGLVELRLHGVRADRIGGLAALAEGEGVPSLRRIVITGPAKSGVGVLLRVAPIGKRVEIA